MDYKREIDGLRAVAVLAVIFFHAGFSQFKGGFVGVDIFFVISGYLIAMGLIQDAQSGSFSLISFYDRRARRILPALFLVVLTTLAMAWFVMSPADMRDLSRSIKATFLLSANLFFYKESGYFSTAAEIRPMLHMWSLSIEEQYYIVAPVALFLAIRFAKKNFVIVFGLIALASLFYAQYLVKKDADAAFLFLPSRVWEFLLGTLAAHHDHFKSRRPARFVCELLSIIGLALIAYAMIGFGKDTKFPGLNALVPTLGAAMVILYARGTAIVGNILGKKILVGIGLISYSAYLWHQPLFALARIYGSEDLGKLNIMVIILAVLCISYFSWRYVEKPFRNKDFIARGRYAYGAASFTILLIGVGAWGSATHGFMFRYPKEIVDPIKEQWVDERLRSKCWKAIEAGQGRAQACLLGERKNRFDFALIGDSHAGSLAEALDEGSKKLGLGGLNMTYRACQSNVLTNEEKALKNRSLCQNIRTGLYQNLDSDAVPRTIVLASRWTRIIEAVGYDNTEGGVEPDGRELRVSHFTTDEERRKVKDEYIKSIQAILDSGRNVLVVYPIPEMGWNVPNKMLSDYAANGLINEGAASTKHSAFKERNKNAYDALDSLGFQKNLYRFYPERILCDTYIAGRCVAHLDGVPIYYDDDHLSRFGAGLVASAILLKINELIRPGLSND